MSVNGDAASQGRSPYDTKVHVEEENALAVSNAPVKNFDPVLLQTIHDDVKAIKQETSTAEGESEVDTSIAGRMQLEQWLTTRWQR